MPAEKGAQHTVAVAEADPPSSLHPRPWGGGTAPTPIRKPYTLSSQSGEHHPPSSQSGKPHTPSSQSGEPHPPSSQSGDCPTCYLHTFAHAVSPFGNALPLHCLAEFCCFLRVWLSHALLWEALCHPGQEERALAILDSQGRATPA